ncbi:MAG: SbcC/MukB-like Walker B domain-containing protein, partial [Reinekea sp.]|nr:SbcC/MukB-like Walker B domain-containing protein [Reinekea sp.]
REKYWFDYQWVPEFKEYWHFFDEVYKSPSIGEGKTLFDTQLSERSLKIRDQLMEMLLDSDEQRALRELERISDYRNYRSYEIYKQPDGKQPIALSQYGTGSGGQLETPAYIIRAAAITSAFRFNEGDSHLRMVLVDEAFSKMDETRSKEVIRYLTESLGLQLLFIMPTSKSGPFMDMISNQFVFSKVPLLNGQRRGELNTKVLVDRQQCNQDKIQELWANHRKVIRKQAELDFLEGL